MSSAESVFGTIFVAADRLEMPTADLLQRWFPTLLTRVCNQLDIEVLPTPKMKNYTKRNRYEALKGEELPRIVVISPGIVGTPRKTGNGNYRAIWRLGIGVACGASDEDEAKLHCDIYAACIREIMVKYAGGWLQAKIEWIDEAYVDLPLTDQVLLTRAANEWFTVDIENVAQTRGGPEDPDQEDASYIYPTVGSVTTTIIKR